MGIIHMAPSSKQQKLKIGIIGLGKMGETLANGLKASSESKQYSIMGLVRNNEKAKEVATGWEPKLRIAVESILNFHCSFSYSRNFSVIMRAWKLMFASACLVAAGKHLNKIA